METKNNVTTIKYKKTGKKGRAATKKTNNDCKLCSAGFDIWASNLNFSSEREEIVRNKLLNYCPICKATKK